MKKLAPLLFAAVLFVSFLSVSAAMAGNVEISIKGPKDVKPGERYEYTYDIKMIDAYSLFVNISCDNTQIDGNLSREIPDEGIFVNTSQSLSGKVSVTISDDAMSGDKFLIKVNGQYNCIVDGLPSSNPQSIDFSYPLTVVPSEQPTPQPTPTPEPSQAPVPAPVPTSEPTAAPIAAPPPPPEPKRTEKPINSVSPAVTETPAPTPSPTVSAAAPTPAANSPSPSPSETHWNALSAELDRLDQGGTLNISMSAAENLPASTLKALKAKEAKLNIDFGGYSCTIDGTKLGQISDDSGACQLAVSLEKDAAISDAADGHDIYQLHFAQTGEMPGRFTYRFDASKSHPGDTLYLYCYHPLSGIVEYKQSAVVDEDGYTSFDIFEGLSYFVTASPIEEIADGPGIALAAPVKDAEDAGSDYFLIIVVALAVLVVAAVGFMRFRHIGIFKNRKRRFNE